MHETKSIEILVLIIVRAFVDSGVIMFVLSRYHLAVWDIKPCLQMCWFSVHVPLQGLMPCNTPLNEKRMPMSRFSVYFRTARWELSSSRGQAAFATLFLAHFFFTARLPIDNSADYDVDAFRNSLRASGPSSREL